MGRIGDFFYHLIIVILVAAALVFLLMAFKEQYPIWKNQQELENLRSKVEKKKTKNENPHINWENLKSTNPEIVGWIKVPGTKIDGMSISIRTIREITVMPVLFLFSQKQLLTTSI